MKTFKGDFDKFKKMIENNESFALSRNNDGEAIILFDEFIDLRQKCNGEFVYDPKQNEHKFFREKLLESAQYKADNYYVGIACRCCINDERHEKLKQLTGQDEEHLTWGNIFVNSNYFNYVKEIIPLFSNYNIVMIINNKAIIKYLPFTNKIVKIFNVGTNAWMDNYNLVDEMKKYIENNNIKNHMFLFAATFSNILIHECFKSSSNNTYLDIGSTLDNIMGLGATRQYLQGGNTIKRSCIW